MPGIVSGLFGFQKAFQFGKGSRVFLSSGGAFRADESSQIQSRDSPRECLGGSDVINVQIVSEPRASVERCRHPADNYELYAAIAQRLKRRFEFHQERLRATPRTLAIAFAARSSLRSLSSGVSRNCSISIVKSIP